MFATLRRFRACLRERRNTRRAAEALYAAAVRQSRMPAFYASAGVPDTLDGRFDLIVLHVWLILRRLGQGSTESRLQRSLQEVAVQDFDRSLREMGVGDLGVGRRVRAMARAQAGRFKAYDAAMDAGESDAFGDALVRNVWRGHPPSEKAVEALAQYVHRQHLCLQNQADAVLAAGDVAFGPLRLDDDSENEDVLQCPN